MACCWAARVFLRLPTCRSGPRKALESEIDFPLPLSPPLFFFFVAVAISSKMFSAPGSRSSLPFPQNSPFPNELHAHFNFFQPLFRPASPLWWLLSFCIRGGFLSPPFLFAPFARVPHSFFLFKIHFGGYLLRAGGKKLGDISRLSLFSFRCLRPSPPLFGSDCPDFFLPPLCSLCARGSA